MVSVWTVENDKARFVVRAVAGALILGAFMTVFWMQHMASAVLTIVWAFVLFAPVRAWPFVAGPLVGHVLLTVGGILLAFIFAAAQNDPNPIINGARAVAMCLPIIVIGLLIGRPHLMIVLARWVMRREALERFKPRSSRAHS